MNFAYSRKTHNSKDRFMERALEILPGALSWFIILFMLALSLARPLAAAILIIAFELYWILRLFYMNIFLVLSYLRLSIEKNTDWLERVRGVANLGEYSKLIEDKPCPRSLKEKISWLAHRKEIRTLINSGAPPPHFNDIYQLIIIPIAKEGPDIIEPAIASLTNSHFPKKRMIVILSLEETAPEESRLGVLRLKEKYGKDFFHLAAISHPSGLPGEAKVKGANATYAAKKALEFLNTKKIPSENVIVSCFDADTVVNPEYFSCLSYYFLITPNRLRSSFQPIPVYHNNIWQAPALSRVLDIGSSFFQLVEATNPDKLVTFSSHSMSFKALIDVNYWPVDMISDDSAIFWKSFIHFDADYSVVPMYVTVSMDITVGNNWWETLVNVYKQKRRWAWGVENFPIVMRAFLKSRGIPLRKKLEHGFKLLEGNISWATWPFLLSIIGWLPALLAGREFSHSIVYYSSPRIKGTIFSLASIGLFSCILLSLLLLPKKGRKPGLFRKIAHALEWLLVPVISVFLSAIPALDAQTRLMFARYMEFWVSSKKRG